MPSKKNKKQKKENKFFKDLKAGLEDVVAYKKGKLTLRSEVIEIPTSGPAGYSAL